MGGHSAAHEAFPRPGYDLDTFLGGAATAFLVVRLP